MQKVISKYGLAAHLALVAVAPLFLFPFFGDAVVATVLLWLTALASVWTLLEPSRRSGEMLHDARSRAASSIAVDPLFWLLALLVVVAGVRWANGGIAISYDAESRVWSLADPGCAFLPGCVKGAGYLPFALSLAVTVLFLACRHCLGKTARLSFLFTSTVLSGVAAVSACVLAALGSPGASGAAECVLGNGSFAGSVFGVHFLMALVAFVAGLECCWNKYFLLFAFAIGANGAGLYFFAPAPVVCGYLAVGAVLAVFLLTMLTFSEGSVCALKFFACLMVGVGVAVLCGMGLAPAGLNEARMAVFSDGSLVNESFGEVRGFLTDAAMRAWGEHRWLGTGVGSFALDVRMMASGTDWALLRDFRGFAPNGWAQLLAERGICGALALAAVFGFLLATLVRRFVSGWRKALVNPVSWLGPVVLATVAVETVYTASLFRPEQLLVVGAVLALAASSIPAARKDEEKAQG